jgi:hypothetical protein
MTGLLTRPWSPPPKRARQVPISSGDLGRSSRLFDFTSGSGQMKRGQQCRVVENGRVGEAEGRIPSSLFFGQFISILI